MTPALKTALRMLDAGSPICDVRMFVSASDLQVRLPRSDRRHRQIAALRRELAPDLGWCLARVGVR